MTTFVRRLLLCLCLAVLPATAEELHGKVVGVTDGDTITVLDADKGQHKIRLAGIDAPEKNQPFGQRSKESLAELVAGKDVTVVTHKQDRHGRDVGQVLLDGRDVNRVQVERGMAWFYRQYQRELRPEDRALYESAETDAKEKRLGLWRDKTPVPPWEWRKGQGR